MRICSVPVLLRYWLVKLPNWPDPESDFAIEVGFDSKESRVALEESAAAE